MNRPANHPQSSVKGPRQQASSRNVRCVVAAICALLVVAVALVYGQAIGYDFVNYDDPELVRDNTMVTRGLTLDGIVWATTTSKLNMWYPLTWISYMIDSQVFGVKPWGYHLTNILWHAAGTVVLFLALRAMTGNLWASALVALLFAVHPMRVEAVAWIGERKSPLSGLFFALTLAAYAVYVRRPFSIARYLAVAGLFGLGLLAKPTLVTLPFVLLLLDYWPLGRWRPAVSSDVQRTNTISSPIPLQWLLLEKVPLLLLSGACAAAAIWSQSTNIATVDRVPLGARFANATVSYAVYLGQFFWPAKLAVLYPRPENVPGWQVAVALAIVLVVSTCACMAWRRNPPILIGWLWFLGMLLPMIGFVPIGSHVRADRYAYLPHIGLAIAAVWGMRGLVDRLAVDRRSRCWLYATGSAIVLAALMAVAWQQAAYWRNSEQLWARAVACTSNNVIADTNLGLALTERGEIGEAIAHFEKALRKMPDCAEAHNGCGNALASRGRTGDAIAHYLRALEIKPEYAEAHNNLGAALARRGKLDGAIEHFRKALEIRPDYAEAHNNLGLALSGQKHFDESIDHYRKSLEIKPYYAEAHCNLGMALADLGQVDEAMVHYRIAAEIKPDYAKPHSRLGLILLSRGQVEEAIGHFRRSLAINPNAADVYLKLGDALAAGGRAAEALSCYRQGLQLTADERDAALAKTIQARIRDLETQGSPR